MRRVPLAVAAVLLLLLTAAAFHALAGNGFLRTFDDDVYLTDNPVVGRGLTLDGALWALSTAHGANWHPLTWLSHMADVSLFGMRPAAHHLAGLALHGANALLLLLALTGLTGAAGPSLLVAGLFALHPLHVESVAWAAERKDLLSTFFALLALLAHLRRRRTRERGASWGSAGLFALALAAKPMPVTLPFLLLLLDWWPLGRWAPGRCRPPGARPARGGVLPPWELWREKAPLFGLALASAAVTLWAQRRAGVIASVEALAPAARLANAALSYQRYLGQAFWPDRLAAHYPWPSAPPGTGRVLAAALAVVALTALAVVLRRSRPYLAVGWLWYLGTLVPAIGLVQVGSQSRADRYTYLPLAGIFLAVAWLAAGLLPRRNAARAAAAAASAALLIALAVRTDRQVRLWRDDETLFRHAAEVTGGSPTISTNLGAAALLRGEWALAARRLEGALQGNPRDARAWSNLGVARFSLGDAGGAEAAFRAAIRLDPGRFRPRYNLAEALLASGRGAEALEELRAAARLAPENPAVRARLAEAEQGGAANLPRPAR